VGVILVKQAKHFLVKSGALGFRNFDAKAFTNSVDTSAGSVQSSFVLADALDAD